MWGPAILAMNLIFHSWYKYNLVENCIKSFHIRMELQCLSIKIQTKIYIYRILSMDCQIYSSLKTSPLQPRRHGSGERQKLMQQESSFLHFSLPAPAPAPGTTSWLLFAPNVKVYILIHICTSRFSTNTNIALNNLKFEYKLQIQLR